MPNPTLAPIAHKALSLSAAQYLKHMKRGKFALEQGVGFTASELPGAGFNFAACLQPCPPLADVVKMGLTFFGNDAWGVQVEGDAGHPIEAEIREQGWAIEEDEPAYLRPDLENLQATSLPFRIISSEAERQKFLNICGIAFGTPPDLMETFMPNLAYHQDPLMGWYIGMVEGQDVVAGGFMKMGPTAVICCLATLPEYRNKGAGAQMTHYCLAKAKAMGCVNACLRSGPLSRPLYVRVGFQYVCQHRTYRWPGVSTSSPG